MPSLPHKAILLAAGFGTRMIPLSYDKPKPMMPLWGVPILEHIVNTMQRWGITDILINLHHNPQPILDWCKQRHQPLPRIQFSFEPDILGTGGALKRASHFIDKAPFWMINTDIAFDLNPEPLLNDFCHHRPLATLWMHDTLGPRTVEMKPDGVITNFSSNLPRSAGTVTFCGMQILSPEILSFLPDKPFCSVVDGYRNALKDGVSVRGLCVPNAYWADIGTPERYLSAHYDILDASRHQLPGGALLLPAEWRRMQLAIPKSAHTNGFVAISRNVVIPPRVSLSNCVVWDNACLHPGCCITDSIAGTATDIYGNQNGMSLIRTAALPPDPVLTEVFRILRTTSDRATLATLPARGSDRSFERIYAGRRSAVLIRYDDSKRPENARYAGHARFLATHHIAVPAVLLDMPDKKVTLFEDAGTRSLQDMLPMMRRATRLTHYRKVIGQLAVLHSIPTDILPTLEPPFSPTLYQWEQDLFAHYFLRDTLKMPAKVIAAVLTELTLISGFLLNQRPVLVHRDFQSSNILIRKKNPVMIDFQGMRLGPAAYDLASLLCDPYAMLNAADREELIIAYCGLTPDAHTVRESFAPAAVQRLAQALGAYGRLSAIPATSRFIRYIPPACTMLQDILNAVPGTPALKAVAACGIALPTVEKNR